MQRNWEKAVRSAKYKYWKEKISKADNRSIWTINKAHTLTHTKAIPNLEGIEDFNQKCDLLRSTLFPQNTNHDYSLPDNFVDSLEDITAQFKVVSRNELKRVLDSANTNSAVGADGINYQILYELDKAAPSILPQIITALLKFGMHGCNSQKWKKGF